MSLEKEDGVLKDQIIGARNFGSFFFMIILFFAGLGFFLAGLSSYWKINLLRITDTTNLEFIPQGIAMLFYGTIALGLAVYFFLSFFWNVGSGYNEFSKKDNVVRIVRRGFPGKNRNLFLSYEFSNIKNLTLLRKQGLNPRYNILLILKDKREIPLFPAQFLLNPTEVEKKAIQLADFLTVPLENLLL